MATAGGGRVPSYRERKTNKKKEQRRKAITAKIFAGLRTQGNNTIPRNYDTIEILKALCNQAGWTVEPDGTTYPKGCKPVEHMEKVEGSAPVSPFSSYNLSPYASYYSSPGSSSLHTPANPSSDAANAYVDGNSLVPWLNKLSASSSASFSYSQLQHVCMQTGFNSGPVTSPLTSTAPTPPNSAFQVFPNPESTLGSLTFSLISSNPFDFKEVAQAGGGSHTWTPGQSGLCSPALLAHIDLNADVSMDEVTIIDEFAFRSSTKKQMNPWEGERIHEELIVSDDLKLTLGTPLYDKKTD